MQWMELYLQKLKQHGIKQHIPNVSYKNISFLTLLLEIKKPKTILEIGTANGYSTIHFAHTIKKWNGTITSIELSPHRYNEAKTHIEALQLNHCISLVLWDAEHLIDTLPETYDFIFIDATKSKSKEFLEKSMKKALPWALIIIDDTIKFFHKMVTLFSYLWEKRIPFCLIPIDKNDGVLLIVMPEW